MLFPALALGRANKSLHVGMLPIDHGRTVAPGAGSVNAKTRAEREIMDRSDASPEEPFGGRAPCPLRGWYPLVAAILVS
jgi:hypothetical protein